MRVTGTSGTSPHHQSLQSTNKSVCMCVCVCECVCLLSAFLIRPLHRLHQVHHTLATRSQNTIVQSRATPRATDDTWTTLHKHRCNRWGITSKYNSPSGQQHPPVTRVWTALTSLSFSPRQQPTSSKPPRAVLTPHISQIQAPRTKNSTS